MRWAVRKAAAHDLLTRQSHREIGEFSSPSEGCHKMRFFHSEQNRSVANAGFIVTLVAVIWCASCGSKGGGIAGDDGGGPGGGDDGGQTCSTFNCTTSSSGGDDGGFGTSSGGGVD